MEISWKNTEVVEQFFDTFEGLTTAELATLAGVSTVTIRRWKKRLGLSSPKPSQFMKNYTPQKLDLEEKIEEDWNNEEWLREKYLDEKLGVAAIAKMLGKRPCNIYLALKRHGIPTRSLKEAVKSDNPCCTKEWLMYHYADRPEYEKWCQETRQEAEPDGGMGLSLRNCAEIAGVSRYTIYNWLVKFRMYIRSQKEAAALRAHPNYYRNGLDRNKKASQQRDKQYERS